jgi:hypothetical protein
MDEITDEIKFVIKYSIEELKKMILDPGSCKPIIIFGDKPIHENCDIEPLPGECFRFHKNGKIEVSNFGRIKYKDEILKQFVHKGKKELRVTKYRVEAKEVHILVAETWCARPNDGKKYDVHHITNNVLDNRACNLLWVTKNQHGKIHPWPRRQITKVDCPV